MWVNIQALRAVAAYMVVSYHLIQCWNDYVGTEFGPIALGIGSIGVDIFFVVSGFVIVRATTGKALSPITFLQKRISRIVPLYWLLSIATAIGMATGLLLFGGRPHVLHDLVPSLLFIPIFTPEGALRQPLLYVGWTLNYEMFFYALFALSLFLERNAHRVIAIAALFLTLTLAAQVTGHHALRYYASPLIWGFVLGMVIAVNVNTVRTLARRHGGGWLIVGSGALLLIATELPALATHFGAIALLRSLGSALIVLGAVYLESSGRYMFSNRLQHQGDASYSIYLTHPFVIQGAGKAMIVMGLNATMTGALLGLTATAVAVALIGTAVHQYVERPMLRWRRPTVARRRNGALVATKPNP